MPPDARPPGGAGHYATCSSCREPFQFDPTFYASKGLHPPSRCRRCREARAAGLTETRGTVSKVGPDYAIINTMIERFICFGERGLVVGAVVVFGVDEEAPRRPGQLRIARRVGPLA